MTITQEIITYRNRFEANTYLDGREVELYLSNGHVVLGRVVRVQWTKDGYLPVTVEVRVDLPRGTEGVVEYTRVFNWDHIVEIRPRI